MEENKVLTESNELDETPIRDYAHEITEILSQDITPDELREDISDYHENDIAEALELVDEDTRNKLYSAVDDDTLSDILEYSEIRNDLIDELDEERKISVLSVSEPTVVMEYLDELDDDDKESILDMIDEDIKEDVSLISSFEETEIGSKMTTNYISISKDCSVKQAMTALIDQAADNDNITTIYVTDEEEHLFGAIDLKDLIIARKDTDLIDITMTSYPYVIATELIDDCIDRVLDYSEDSIPVLSPDNKLIGVLISQDLARLIDDEMSDDYAKLAGLTSEEESDEPLKKSIGKRLPWLLILLGLGLAVSSVVSMFEHVVASLTLIVAFQSLILGMAGNVGTQSLAVTIRVLMDENITGKGKLQHIIKETKIGLINGFLSALLSFGVIGLYIYLFKDHSLSYAFSVSFCTSISLFLAMLFSGIVGTVVPIIFKKLKIDPAVASGPLITTINDLVAVLLYYGISWLLLINILGL